MARQTIMPRTSAGARGVAELLHVLRAELRRLQVMSVFCSKGDNSRGQDIRDNSFLT
jgi:hypothetical protein